MTIIPYRKTRNVSPVFTGGFDEFDRVFDNFFKNALTNLSGPAASVTDMPLRMDVTETEKVYMIKTDLPGLEDKDVDITVDEGILTIAGEKQRESEESGKTFHRVERSYGNFRRSLALPADADPDNIKARMKNGVLEVEIGKAKTVKKDIRKISVHS